MPFVDNYTNIFVREALLRVTGVGDVFTRADDFSMRIWLQPDKLAQLGLTANDVVNALAEQNLQIAAGSVGAPPQFNAQAFEYTVFTNSRLSSEDQFRKIIVRSNPPGRLRRPPERCCAGPARQIQLCEQFVRGRQAGLIFAGLPGSGKQRPGRCQGHLQDAWTG